VGVPAASSTGASIGAPPLTTPRRDRPALLYEGQNLERIPGIEPGRHRWQRRRQPLRTRLEQKGGIEPRSAGLEGQRRATRFPALNAKSRLGFPGGFRYVCYARNGPNEFSRFPSRFATIQCPGSFSPAPRHEQSTPELPARVTYSPLLSGTLKSDKPTFR
jgi:hypothetical protein